MTNLFGCECRFTPPASAVSHWPLRMASQARWMAVSEEEHMVSTVMLGPRKS